MNSLYFRIYYTIQRGLIWFGNEDNDSPRFTAILIFSFLIFLNLITLLTGLAETAKIDFAINYIAGIIALIGLIVFNWYSVNKKNSKEVESRLSKTWQKDWNKNILITIAYFILSILMFLLLIIYLNKNQ